MNIHSLSYKQAESLELVIKAAKLWISFSLYTQPISVVFDRIFIRPDFLLLAYTVLEQQANSEQHLVQHWNNAVCSEWAGLSLSKLSQHASDLIKLGNFFINQIELFL